MRTASHPVAAGAARADTALLAAALRMRTDVVMETAARLYDVDLLGWRVCLDLKGMAAGQVQFRTRRLRYNLAIAAQAPGTFLSTTVPHEVAHIVCHLRHGHGIRPHGPEWRSVCLALGGTGERCHGFAAQPARRLQRYDYACGCRRWSLTSIRVRRIRSGMIYHCRACGRELRGVGA
ncbi:MAG: SprT-like domain-containing protein [Gammaproteobacteria bacterium]|nr:SprT-like domain-containing protein [Gammaproteobacteria bacterium]MCG3143649.1 Protein SprT [Gammaproteobacteria bacterium]